MKISPEVKEFIEVIPLVDLQETVNPMTMEGRRKIIDELDAVIQRAARIRGYVDMRYGSGCGDQGHVAGVKESNKLVNKIRKALGFTYPKADVRF